MIKVNNKKVVSGLAKKAYLANGRKNILTVVAIMLTTFMITTICSMGISYWNAMTRRSILMEGMKYDVQVPEPTKKQTEKARQIESIQYAGVSVKCAIIDKAKDKPTHIRLFWSDNTNWEKQRIPALEFFKGTYPDKQKEVVMSTNSLKAMGIANPRIGMKLDVSYSSLEEGDDTSYKTQFTLSGYYRDYTGNSSGFVSKKFYDKTGVKQTDISQGYLNISLKNPIYNKKDIKLLGNELGLVNNQIIFADYDLINSFIKFITGIIGLFLLSIVSGYLFIYNILYISVSKEVRFYGQLKTIGMTSKQIKGIVKKQITWNSLIGIPLGLVFGSLISFYLVPYMLHIANPTLKASQKVVFHPVIFIGAIVFSLMTVYISCRKPAMIAGNIAPIEAAKYVAIRSLPKYKKSRNGGKLTNIAWRNMFRNKKQAVLIMLSFYVALTAFISVNAIVKSNSAKNVLNYIYRYDIRILNNTVDNRPEEKFNQSTLKRLDAFDGISSIRKVISSTIQIRYDAAALSDYYDRLSKMPFIPVEFAGQLKSYKANNNKKDFTGKIVGIDEKGFDVMNKQLGNKLDKKEFMSGKVGIIKPGLDISAKEAIGKIIKYMPCEGSSEHAIKIAAEWDFTGPNYFAAGWSPDLIVSDQLVKQVLKNPVVELIDIDYTKPFSKTMDKKIKKLYAGVNEISFDSKLDDYIEMKRSENQMRILGGGLGIILAFLAVLNYGNMIATSIQSRSREFAILQSIGMTEKQIKKVVLLEGIGYGVISIGMSTLFGGPVSYLVFKATDRYGLDLKIPIWENLAVFLCILIICALVPLMVYHIIQKKSSLIEEMQETC